ncbi:uncharacterized protein LOC135110296 [Scylla paramamosain]|uniref:uncharacterized protein LOC135110296 n=1 Tax=Scylla paramamosain TaxID=85552 RepID=UPI0030834207
MDYRMMEKLEPCPYNNSHQILPHRMAKHIIKCKKNYPNADMKVCLFNAVHVVPTHQYQAHLLECENRELVERELYSSPRMASSAPLVKIESVPVENVTARCEDWESDLVQSSYSPEEHSIYKEFIRRTPAGLSKGARKVWRLKEIERVNRLQNGLMVGDSQSDTNTSMPDMTYASPSGGWAASGAISKLQDKFKFDVSKPESIMVNRQMHQKDMHPDTATAFTSLKEPNYNDKSEKPKNRPEMTDFIKEKRKLEKKLFEIKKLENMKADLNEKLTVQEESKILLKKNIEEKLSNLMAGMNM